MIPVRNANDIGALIRERRRRLELDQQSLAERAGVGRQWIVDVEHGKPGASIGLVFRTLDALGLGIAVEDVPEPTLSAATDIDAVVRRARKRHR